MQASRLWLVDIGYGHGYLDSTGRSTVLAQAQEWPWNEALALVRKLRKRGYTGAEAVEVTNIPAKPTENCDVAVT